MITNLEVVHRYCKDNKLSLLNSTNCGCFYCGSIYNPRFIKKYVGKDNESALCTFCGIDAVLADWDVEITPELLSEMKDRWFCEGRSIDKIQPVNIPTDFRIYSGEQERIFDHYAGIKKRHWPFIWLFKTFNEIKEWNNEREYPSDRIPNGRYCYTIKNIYEINGEIRRKTNPCPYWELVDGYHHQECGYCKKTGIKDWEEEYISLLWDGCKSCGINEDDDLIDVPSDTLKVL